MGGSADWRMAMARALVESGRRPKRAADGLVNRAWRFLTARAAGRSGRDPELAAVAEVAEGDARRRSMLEAALLTEAAHAEIGDLVWIAKSKRRLRQGVESFRVIVREP